MNVKLACSLCVLAVGMAMLLQGCTDGQTAESATAGTHLVQLYSGGKKVRQWHSTDTPSTPTSARIYWYFTDVKTERHVRVSGTVIVTKLD